MACLRKNKKHKAGTCTNCGKCKGCNAPKLCLEPTNHIPNRPKQLAGRKRDSSEVKLAADIARAEDTFKEPDPVYSATKEEGKRRSTRDFRHSIIDLQKALRQEALDEDDDMDDGPTKAAIALGIQLFRNDGDTEALEEIVNVEMNARQSLIRTIKEATTNSTKAEIIRTYGSDLNLSSQFFVTSLKARADSFNSKEKLEILFSALGLQSSTNDLALFCKQGYSGTDLSDHNSRAFRRIQSVYRSVLLALDNTVFSDNLPDVLRSSIVDEYSKLNFYKLEKDFDHGFR